jgi:CheY-like chemotaxis protein
MGVKFELTAAEEAQLGEAIARIAIRQRRALLVDDDVLARRILADALAERGFDLFAAEDGTSALSILTDELLTLDLVVTDLRMPGMDGEALLNTIRKAGGETDLAVVMVTAGLAPRIEERLRGAGADAVLDKALGPEAIARAGEAAVERRRLERAGQRADSHPLS